MMKDLVITAADLFMYRHMLEKSLEGLVSGFVDIGTDVMAVLLLPA